MYVKADRYAEGIMARGLRKEFGVFKRELELAPRQVRVRLLERIEEFLAGLETGRQYPFDYIFYAITDHRPETADSPLVPGDEVALELARVLYDVGRTMRVAADSIEEKVFTVEELSRHWGVSTATILRWRDRASFR